MVQYCLEIGHACIVLDTQGGPGIIMPNSGDVIFILLKAVGTIPGSVHGCAPCACSFPLACEQAFVSSRLPGDVQLLACVLAPLARSARPAAAHAWDACVRAGGWGGGGGNGAEVASCRRCETATEAA